MAFDTGTLKSWSENIRGAFRANLPGSDAWLWPSVLYVIAKVFGAMAYEINLRLRWLVDQAFVSTAEGNWLDRHATQYGLSRKAASFSAGKVKFTGTIGTTLLAGQTVQRSDGVTFTTTETVDIPNIGYIEIAATADASGSNSNSIAGTVLSQVVPIAAVSAVEVGTDGIGGGADEEGDEPLRSRILFRLQFPPHGGSQTDYEQWALEVPGVTRAWAKGNAFGPGTIGIWFMMDDSYVDGIPLAADVTALQTYIDTLKPITARPFVFAPTKECVDITITGMSVDNGVTRVEVAEELADMFLRNARPGLPDDPFGLRVSWIWQAISNATGEDYHTLTAPTTDLTFGPGVIPGLGSITFN